MSEANAVSGRRHVLFYFLTVFLVVVLMLLIYGLSVLVRGVIVYEELHRPQQPMQGGRYIGQAYASDPQTGLVPAPGAEGAWLIARGSPVPFRHDAEGLRVADAAMPPAGARKYPRVLFLGDSFTYGQMVRNEDSFAYKTAQKLGGESVNAGVPGYGLAQMVLRSRTLIPRYRPDFVVVQYSPWLVERSQSEFYTDASGLVMSPYFFDGKAGVSIALPRFTVPPRVHARVAYYKQAAPGLANQLAFLTEVAWPFFLERDTGLVTFRLRQWLGLQPRPTKRADAVIRAAYAEIDATARAHGARMVVLVLGRAEEPLLPSSLFPPQTAGVHGWLALVHELPLATPDEYRRHYYLWRGNPPQMVDSHPSEAAHEIIAKALADRLRGLSASSP